MDTGDSYLIRVKVTQWSDGEQRRLHPPKRIRPQARVSTVHCCGQYISLIKPMELLINKSYFIIYIDCSWQRECPAPMVLFKEPTPSWDNTLGIRVSMQNTCIFPFPFCTMIVGLSLVCVWCQYGHSSIATSNTLSSSGPWATLMGKVSVGQLPRFRKWPEIVIETNGFN